MNEQELRKRIFGKNTEHHQVDESEVLHNLIELVIEKFTSNNTDDHDPNPKFGECCHCHAKIFLICQTCLQEQGLPHAEPSDKYYNSVKEKCKMLNNKEKLKAINEKANNALYFDDSSDYKTALWEILEIINPEIFSDNPKPKLKFIN